MTNYHVITHTHWDREWYFTKEETKVLLHQHILDLFAFLEKNPKAIYVLDGQSVMIDDFLQVAPEYKIELTKYIQSGNILVGPWYTQTDLMLVRGESIIRNLQIGLKTAEKYTQNPMLVGYAPDTFGHNAQMPQIYKAFGIDSTYFWRGVSKQKVKKANFYWQALDGSTVFAHSLIAGYQGGKYLINNQDNLNTRLKVICEKYQKYEATTPVLVMNGHDQMPVQTDLFTIMKEYNENNSEDLMVNADFPTYQKIVETQENLETISGELYDAEFTRVHKTISSTRMDIKLLNTQVEDEIYNHLEPLAVIGSTMGIPYPHALIEKALKILFGVHAHDSIGGCNTDAVNQAIYQRLLDAKELVENQIAITLRQIGLTLKAKGYDAFVVNVLPYTLKNFKTTIELQTESKTFKIEDINGREILQQLQNQELVDMADIDRQILARRLDVKRYISNVAIEIAEIEGLTILPLKLKDIAPIQASSNSDLKNLAIENEYYKIDITNGVNIYLKKQDKSIENFIFIENNGDAGDGYDYSPLKNDWLLSQKDFKFIECIAIHKGKLEESLKLKFAMEVPKNEKYRKTRKQNTQQEYIIDIVLKTTTPEIELTINMVNISEDQRTRLAIKTTKLVEKVTADIQFGEITRPSINPNLAIWEKANWVEKPVSIEHFESYVSLDSKNTVYAKGLKEYEHINDTLYFTLMRSFGYMGRSDLINRPGRASGMAIKTPLNQLLNQEFTFNFWLNYYEEKTPAIKAKKLLTNVLTYQTKEFNRFNLNVPPNTKIAENNLLAGINLENILITTIKRNDAGEFVLRGVNHQNSKVEINLPSNWCNTDMREKEYFAEKVIMLKPYQIFTLLNKKI